MSQSNDVPLHDFGPELSQMRDEVVEGLRRPQKWISPKFFYDEAGSQLFDRICELDDYYPTATELGIMRDNIDEIAALLGDNCKLIEFGSGSSLKTRVLLDHLTGMTGYVPIDISKEHLRKSADAIKAAYPDLEVLLVCADFTEPFDVPRCKGRVEKRVAYFPGSTIGNLLPDEAVDLLKNVARICGPGDGLLIGVDLIKDPAILKRAYNDREGVTAAFNLNLLTRLNRELDADFDLGAFRHEAIFNADLSRIEMHLVSKRDQVVHLDGVEIPFRTGESIHTENSHKFTPETFATLAARAGFTVEKLWTDAKRLFSVQYLTIDGA